jgi:hypothetical protein
MRARLETHSVQRQIVGDGFAKIEPHVASTSLTEVIPSSSQTAESLQVKLPAVESSLVAQTSKTAPLPGLSDAVQVPEISSAIAPAANLGQAKDGEVQSQAQASAVAAAAAPVLAVAPIVAGVEDATAAEAAVELPDGDTNPVLKTLQQLQVA